MPENSQELHELESTTKLSLDEEEELRQLELQSRIGELPQAPPVAPGALPPEAVVDVEIKSQEELIAELHGLTAQKKELPRRGPPPEVQQLAPRKLDLGHPITWPNRYGEVQTVSELWELEIKPYMYPETGLYPLYFKWAQSCTDVPLANHWACLTTGVASCLGRWHRIEDGHDGVVPSVFALVLAKSGQRKSFGMKILRSILPNDIRDTQFPRSDVALLQLLKKEPWRLWLLDEASKLFKILASQYQTQAIENLVHVYDGDTVAVYTQTNGTLRSPPSFLCLLGATTLASMLESKNLSEAQLHELIYGGLFGRFFICPATNEDVAEEDTLFEPLKRDPVVEQYLKDWMTELHGIGQWRGRETDGDQHHTYKLSKEARIELHRWIEQTGAGGVKNKIPHPGLTSFWNRAPLQAKRLALIYHLSKGEVTLDDPIDADTMVRAIRFVYEYLAPAFLWFVQYATRTGVAQVVQRVADVLQRARYGLRYKELCEKCNINLQQRTEVLAILDDKIHYEKWKNVEYNQGEMVMKPGAPHLVVVWGTEREEQRRLDDGSNLRPGEVRMQGGIAAAPPSIAKLVAEKKFGDVDITTPEEINDD